MKGILSFADFCKQTPPNKEVKGEHELVKQHYDEGGVKTEDLSDPKDSTEKGNGSAEHTEEIKADDLSNPKLANAEK